MMDVMAGYRDPPSRAERVSTIVTVTAIHVALGALALHVSRAGPEATVERPIHTFDVAPPPPEPPPPPPPEPKASPPEHPAGAPARSANPSPVVAPVPRIELPPRMSIPAGPRPGTGSSAAAGAGADGTGSGGAGTGSGSGGGGTGGAGGGIGEDARLLGGGLGRRDYRSLRAFAVPSGRAVLALMVGPDGRVASCTVRQSSGDARLDAALCALLQPRMQWAPARDRAGRPLTVGILYTAVWRPD